MTIIEVCVEDVDAARAAREAGADRVELCSSLHTGGLTPKMGDIAGALTVAPPLGVRVLVRSNPNTFDLTDEEARQQAEDIAMIRQEVADQSVPLGFVVGGLSEGILKRDWLQSWRQAAGDHALVFHRAFDQLPDFASGIRVLIEEGFDGVLTTGSADGKADLEVLRELREMVGEDLAIIASGGLRAHNVAQVIESSGVQEVHFRAPYEQGPGTDPQLVETIVAEIRGVKHT